METQKIFLIFRETELFYISGNFLYFRKKLPELEKGKKKTHSKKMSYVSGNQTF